MPGDPADIGRAPIDLAGPVIERQFMAEADPDQIAAGGMKHALGLAGRSRGIEDEQRILRVHRFGPALGGRLLDQIVIPEIAIAHRDVATGRADDNDFFQPRRVVARRIDIGLERDLLAAAPAFVGGDHQSRSAILDPPGERFGREAAEHHRMDRPDPRAGQDRHRGFGDHRHIDGDAVALGHALGLQRIGEAADVAVQLAIGDAARLFGGIVGLPDQGDGVAARRQMAVETIGRGIEHAVSEPADAEIVLPERPVAGHFRPLDPVEPARLFEPEGAGIGQAAAVQLFIAGAIDLRALGPIARYRIDALLGHALSLVHPYWRLRCLLGKRRSAMPR